FESGLPSANFSSQGVGQAWTTNSAYSFAGTQAAYYQTSAGNPNGYLVSKVMNLSGSTRPLLSFYHIAALEKYFDHAIVEVSTNAGITWTVPDNQQYNG